LENIARTSLGQFKNVDYVIPAWSAGIQIDMDASGRILVNLDAGYQCRHDEDHVFHSPWAKRKRMWGLSSKS